ncbi:MAG: hypothetical protein R3C16_05765 [Hyphomonadaceae bacterium]
MPNPEKDPYAPPPRHRDRSGALVRLVILAALLGGAAWGYMAFVDRNPEPLVASEQTQDLADTSLDQGYQVRTPTAEDAETAPAEPASTEDEAPAG